jgi:hypothetical protein
MGRSSPHIGQLTTANATIASLQTQLNSTDFPTTASAYQTSFVGGTADAVYGIPVDLFVTKLELSNTPTGADSQVVVNTQSTTITQATLNFANVYDAGLTTIGTDSTGPTPPATYSLGNQPTYVEISSTSTFSGDIAVCFTYNPSHYGDPTKSCTHAPPGLEPLAIIDRTIEACGAP